MVLENALQRCSGFTVAEEVPDEVRDHLSAKAKRLLAELDDANSVCCAEELIMKYGIALMYASFDGKNVWAEVRVGETPTPLGLWSDNGKALAKSLLKELAQHEFMFEL